MTTKVGEIFGKHKLKISTAKLIRIIDEELDPE